MQLYILSYLITNCGVGSLTAKRLYLVDWQ